MHKDSLLDEMAYDLGLTPNEKEYKREFNSRVLFSAAAKTGLVSLWDHEETDEANSYQSIIGFKSRIVKFLNIMTDSFSDYFLPVFTTNPEEIASMIYSTYLGTGCIYHNQYHCYPAIKTNASFKNVCFSRGSAPGEQLYMSGAGEYEIISSCNDDSKAFIEMFQLDEESPVSWFNRVCEDANWTESLLPEDADYLNVKDGLYGGYFIKKDDNYADVSLLRYGLEGRQNYCLYKKENNKYFLSQLPLFMTHTPDGNADYFRIMNAILMKCEKLKPIDADIHSNTVTVGLGALLPRNVYDFFRLYSWPSFNDYEAYKSRSHFIREMSKPVYFTFHDYMTRIGYQFKEKTDG